MGNALVVYESMFGDARQIAEAVAAGLATRHEVECVEVGTAPPAVPAGIGLLVVGSPTHSTALPRKESREMAAEKTDEPLVSRGIGVREWLAALPAPEQPVAAVTFDTRMDHPKLVTRFDHAAKSAAKSLRKLGFSVTSASQSFIVTDVKGPLAPGEVDRAKAWGEQLTELLH